MRFVLVLRVSLGVRLGVGWGEVCFGVGGEGGG